MIEKIKYTKEILQKVLKLEEDLKNKEFDEVVKVVGDPISFKKGLGWLALEYWAYSIDLEWDNEHGYIFSHIKV